MRPASVITPPLPRTADCAVVGAGVMGLWTGLHLARAGKAVVILERGEPWREASGINAGSLALQNKRLPLLPFAMEGIRAWCTFRDDFGREVGYVQCGGLRVATSDEEVARLRRSAAEQREAGLETEWLEGASLRARAPWLGPGVRAATLCTADSFANPLLAGRALIQAFEKAGGRLAPGAEVRAVSTGADGLRLETPRGSLSSRTLVIAAGAWSGQIARLLGVDLPIHLDVNMLTVTEPAAPLMSRIVTHIRGILTVKQPPSGTCIIGGGWQGRGDLSTGLKDIEYAALLHNLRLAEGIIPGLRGLHILRCWAGFEGVTPDSLPIFGRLPGHPDVFITTCARGGWGVGPALGRLMAELIVTGKTSMPVAGFDPGRFLP